MVIRCAEVVARRGFLIFSHMYAVAHQFVHALVSDGGNGHYGYAEHALHVVYAYMSAVALHLVHHVEGENHGYTELHQLHGEVEVALDVGGVDNVYYPARPLIEYKFAADN